MFGEREARGEENLAAETSTNKVLTCAKREREDNWTVDEGEHGFSDPEEKHTK